MTEADWQSEFFQSIKKFDEVSVQNSWMELFDFKSDLRWEWPSSVGPVMIGLVWSCGFLWFFCAARSLWAGRGVFCFWRAWRVCKVRRLVDGLIGVTSGEAVLDVCQLPSGHAFGACLR